MQCRGVRSTKCFTLNLFQLILNQQKNPFMHNTTMSDYSELGRCLILSRESILKELPLVVPFFS